MVREFESSKGGSETAGGESTPDTGFLEPKWESKQSGKSTPLVSECWETVCAGKEITPSGAEAAGGGRCASEAPPWATSSQRLFGRPAPLTFAAHAGTSHAACNSSQMAQRWGNPLMQGPLHFPALNAKHTFPFAPAAGGGGGVALAAAGGGGGATPGCAGLRRSPGRLLFAGGSAGIAAALAAAADEAARRGCTTEAPRGV